MFKEKALVEKKDKQIITLIIAIMNHGFSKIKLFQIALSFVFLLLYFDQCEIFCVKYKHFYNSKLPCQSC